MACSGLTIYVAVIGSSDLMANGNPMACGGPEACRGLKACRDAVVLAALKYTPCKICHEHGRAKWPRARSVTQGQGEFSMEFKTYAPMPAEKQEDLSLPIERAVAALGGTCGDVASWLFTVEPLRQ